MTEMSPLGTFNSPSADFDTLSREEQWAQRLRVGRPVYGVEVKIVDAAGRELPWDGVSFGALKVRGPWICSEYFRIGKAMRTTMTAGSRPAMSDHRSARLRRDHRSHEGRDQVRRRVDKLDRAGEHRRGPPGRGRGRRDRRAHPRWAERPLLCVVLHPGAQLAREEMLAWFEGKVAKWWVPDDVSSSTNSRTRNGQTEQEDLRERMKDYRFRRSGV